MATATSPITDRRPSLKPPQFRLRTLMWTVAVICVLLAAMKTAGPTASLILGLLVLAVIAHVMGNALGTRLRENGDRPLPEDGQIDATFSIFHRKARRGDYAPATRLRDRVSLGRAVFVIIAVGALIGAASGGGVLAWANWERATILNIAMGTFASAVLGGFLGFVSSSFIEVAFGALSHALRDEVTR